MTTVPHCPRCGQPLAVFDGESYCPDCTSYRPTPTRLSTPQVLMLGSLKAKGWPCELAEYLIGRCGAEQADLDALLSAGFIEAGECRIVLTPAGKRALAAEKATHRHWA